MNNEKSIIEILIKNSNELNNKIENFKNIEKEYMDKNAKLSIELVEAKIKLEDALIKIRDLENKTNLENKDENKDENNEPVKKKLNYGDFLERKNRLSRTWKTLDEYHKKRESKIIPPKKIEMIE